MAVSTAAKRKQFKLTVQAKPRERVKRIFYGKLTVTEEWRGFGGTRVSRSWEFDGEQGLDMQICSYTKTSYAMIDNESCEHELVLFAQEDNDNG